MNQNKFSNLVQARIKKCLVTLAVKSTDYASKEDRLHNFKSGATLTGQTELQFAFSLASKHIIALRDKISKKEYLTDEFIEEKITDIINYMILIEAIREEDED